MPEEKGLYWARVGDLWMIVNVDERAIDSPAAQKRNGAYVILEAWGRWPTIGTTRFHPHFSEIDEWGARVVEPEEG